MTPNLNKKIQTRLRAVALGVAGVHLLSLALDPVNLLLGFSPPSHLLEKNIISGSLIVISLLVYIVNRHGSAESRFAKHASTFASAYHIIVAAGIELSAQLTPWPAPEAFPYPAMRLVSWVALWIVIYPLFVPLRPRRAALTALAAATMGPLTLALTLLVGNTWPGVGVAVFVHMPSLVAASLAAISARIVYGLETRASSTRLLGNYVLKERIAQGGMGDIWEASHRLLARPAAVKLIRTHPDDDPALQARRFEREARATATLESPHTVELYDFGRDDDGTFYYVMELLEGLDLEDLVEHHGPQPSSRTIHVLRQVCDSLAEAHDKGLLHRDIKPSNIFIEPRGLSQDTVKVLDFGLVLAFGQEDTAETRLTQETSLRGTPSYTAPEIALNEEPIDGRADLYSLGCVAYWLVTGRPPFDRGSPLKTLLAQVQDEPAPPSTFAPLPHDLETIILRCLRKDPADRPANARSLSALLAACETATAWTAADAETFWTPWRKRSRDHDKPRDPKISGTV